VQNVPFIGLRDGRYPTQALPTVTYSISMTLCQDGQHLTSVNYGPAHTDGDTIIYISPANVAVVGDIFSNHLYPIIDLASGGSIDGMIHSLDQILAQTDEQTQIVPGHWASSYSFRSTGLPRHAGAGSATHQGFDRRGEDNR